MTVQSRDQKYIVLRLFQLFGQDLAVVIEQQQEFFMKKHIVNTANLLKRSG